MKLSKTFWQTYKEVPNDAEIPSHQLMIRAGLMQKTAAGLYNYLPFLVRTISKVENIIREEMNKIDCQEVIMTVVTSGDLWKESGRWQAYSDEMLKFQDKGGRDLCISPTNEEAISDIFRKTIKSYKQLPSSLFQINTKFRDEIRPRFGLLRGREFIMKDAYTFHIDKACMDKAYDEMYGAYEAVFNRIGFDYFAVEADGGAMADGEAKTHEFQALAENGEDEIIFCSTSNYAANREKAKTKRAQKKTEKTSDEVAEVSTPEKATIDEVANFLKVDPSLTLKSLIYAYTVDDKTSFAMVNLLGDDELNELKLSKFLETTLIRPATDAEISSLKLVKGFIGPHEIPSEMKILFDSEVDTESAYIIGAQKIDFHKKNFVPKRDCSKFETVDVRLSQEGDLTEKETPVEIKRGIEVGQVFQLWDKYTKSMGVTVLDNNGKATHPLMGCYGIGVTRTVAAAVEQNHDEKGIVWPKPIAPFQVYFALIGKSDKIKAIADEIYSDLLKKNIEVLFDDRNAGAGFKFKDADLLGLPLRLVLGERDFNASGELQVIERKTGKEHKVSKDQVSDFIIELLDKI